MPLSSPQPLVDKAARRRRRTIALMVGSNLCVALLIAAIVHTVLGASKRSHAAQAAAVAEGLANIAASNIESELGRVDAVIRATAAEVERLQEAGPPGQPAVQQVLQARLGLLDGVEGLRLADAEGKVRWGNDLPADRLLDVSDRDDFRQLKGGGTGGTIVTGPLRSRLSGNWVMVFARPILAGGRFRGMVYATIAVARFGDLFDQYDLADKDSMSLRTRDLRLLARRSPGSPKTGEVGSTTVSEPLRAALADRPQSGSFVAKALVDGIERTMAYRAVEGWPFVVYAGLDNERFFKPWRRHAATVSALAALSWVIVALATFIVHRASRREAQAMQALAGQTLRTRALLRIAGDGIHILNREGRLVEMSDSFGDMLRSSRQALIGRPVWSWDVNQDQAKIESWLSRIKDGDSQRVNVQHRRDDGTVIDVELQMRVADVGGQLLVFGSGRDVSERNRLLREQAAMLDSDLVGMAKVEGGAIAWANAAMEKILGHGPGGLTGQPERLLHADDDAYAAFARKAHPLIHSGQPHRTQLRTRRKGGEPVWIDLSGVRLGDSQVFWMALDITAMKEAHDTMAHAAFHDPLTKLPNRLLLADRLKQALSVAAREATQVAVCFIDLDGFKAVNDERGHDAGDGLLVEVARRLASGIRPTDTAARLGGDEFVLLLAAAGDSEWRAALDRIVSSLAQPVVLQDGQAVSIGATIGVALSGRESEGLDDLLEKADQAMLRGKRSGKGGVFLSE